MKRSVFEILIVGLFCTHLGGAQTLRASEPFQELAGYSAAVAVGDGLVYVGEPANTMTPGFVYVYSKDDSGNWTETARLTAENGRAGDGFGSALALDNNVLAVTANGDGTGGIVYVFEKGMEGNWEFAQSLMAPDASVDDGFGSSLAVHGQTILVSAPEQNDGTGAVYVFNSDGSGTWSMSTKLVAGEGESGDTFGASLAMTEQHVFIGTPGKRGREGVVVLFENEMGSWVEKTSLSAFGLERNSRFGFSVAVAGERLVVGAARHQRSTGAVFTYRLEDGEWNQVGTLVPFDASPNVRFGSSVHIVHGNVWAGAPGANGFIGAIYMIKSGDEGGWESAMKITPLDGSRRTRFGEVVAVDETVAVIGRPGADGGAGSALIYEFLDGAWVEAASLVGAVEGLDSITGSQRDCVDGKSEGFDCESVDMISFLSLADLGGGRGVNLNDIWGWTDPVTGKEWALVGRTDGTTFVDVSDPSNPFYAGQLMLTEGAQPNAWRDIKVYKNHAYIVADGAGAHGMQIFDLTRLRDVTDAPETFTADAHYDNIASAHNIVINEDTGFAYAVGVSGGGETCGGGLHMINIQDPKNPVFAGCFSDAGTGRSGTGYSHDAMCIVYHGPDSDHEGKEICIGANETALSIADVSDKENTVSLSSASYPNVSYAHQGWITDDHKYFYLNDELDELQGRVPSTRTMIWDITDLDDPQLIKEYQSATKASDHNLYIRGNYMYQSNYVAGLRILDISDPMNPVEVAYFDTVPAGENVPGFEGSWSNYPYFESGIIVVTSISEGLFIVKHRSLDI